MNGLVYVNYINVSLTFVNYINKKRLLDYGFAHVSFKLIYFFHF